MVGKILLGLTGATALAGAYVVQQGAVRIQVDDKRPDGRDVNLVVPAALVTLGVKAVPEAPLRQALNNAAPLLPVLRVASEELARRPDANLVEVRTDREYVQIQTVGRRLVIHVESDREDVHIALPLKMLQSVARELEALKPVA